MNHSCDPNCWWNSYGDLIVRTKISKREEITYDYSTHDVGYTWSFPWKCKCGSDNCRGKILTSDILKEEIYLRYIGHLPCWVQDYYRNNT